MDVTDALNEIDRSAALRPAPITNEARQTLAHLQQQAQDILTFQSLPSMNVCNNWEASVQQLVPTCGTPCLSKKIETHQFMEKDSPGGPNDRPDPPMPYLSILSPVTICEQDAHISGQGGYNTRFSYPGNGFSIMVGHPPPIRSRRQQRLWGLSTI